MSTNFIPGVYFTKMHHDAQLPTYATDGAAGADVRSIEQFTLYPDDRRLVRTGLNCVIPIGWEIQVRPRSGLAYKHGVTVLNAPGTIDSDYQGELGVLLINHGNAPFMIEVGDRIAQIVVARADRAIFAWTEAVDRETARGADGFGSTGAK